MGINEIYQSAVAKRAWARNYTQWFNSMVAQGKALKRAGFIPVGYPTGGQPKVPPMPAGWGAGLTQPPPNQNAVRDVEERARSWGAIRNLPVDPKKPIPIIYGKQRIVPPLISGHVDAAAAGERLKLLFLIGEGPVKSIGGLTEDVDNLEDLSGIGDKIRLNGQPVSDFEDVKISVRMGTQDQKFVRGFQNVHNEQPVSDEDGNPVSDTVLSQNSPITHTTRENDKVDAVKIHLRAGPIWSVKDETGEYHSQEVVIFTRYRTYTPGGTSAWQDGGTVTLNENIHTDVRRVHKISFPHSGRWQVKVNKKTPNSAEKMRSTEVRWATADEIQEDQRSYEYCAQLAVKVLPTEDLSGSPPTVDVVTEGKVIQAPYFTDALDAEFDYDEVYHDNGAYKTIAGGTAVTREASTRLQYCRNPYYCSYDLLLNTRYGAGLHLTAADINQTALIDSADTCQEMVATYADDGTLELRFRLDILLDSQALLGDAVKRIMTCCRGVAFEAGSIMLRMDKKEDPAYLYTSGNNLAGSFSHAWGSDQATFNRVHVSFFNEAKEWEEDSVAVVVEDGRPDKPMVVFLHGVTRRSQAKRLGSYLLKAQLYQEQTLSLNAATDACSLIPYDIISVANPLPRWGTGDGAVTAIGAAPNTFTMNQDVTLPAGESYLAQFRESGASDSVRQIAIAAGTSGDFPAGTPIPVDEAVPPSALHGPVAIGEINVVTKPFRIMDITLERDFTSKIKAIEYHEGVFDDLEDADEPTNYSELPTPSLFPASVESLTATNYPGDHNYTVQVDWRKPAPQQEYGPWKEAQVHRSSDGGETFIKVATTSGESFKDLNLQPGGTYTYAVVSVSGYGQVESLALAPQVEIKVQVTEPPPDVTGLEVRGETEDGQYTGRHAVFQWRAASIASKEGLLGPLGAGNTAEDPHLKGYQVEIWSGGVLRRTESPGTNEYDYTYEKNRLDHGGVASRTFEIKVWALDRFNVQSLKEAALEVTNPIPGQVENLTARGSFESIILNWSPTGDADQAGYVVRRDTVADNDWNLMEEIAIVKDNALATIKEPLDPTDVVYYFKVAAFDDFTDINSTAEKNALVPSDEATVQASGISGTDIDSFAVNAADIWTGVPVPQGINFSSNTGVGGGPDPGNVSWTAGFIYFTPKNAPTGGESRTNAFIIPAGETGVAAPEPGDPTFYIWWRTKSGEGATAPILSQLEVSTENPGSPPTDDDGNPLHDSLFQQAMDDPVDPAPFPGGYVIAVNRLGSVTPALNAVANEIVGTSMIQFASVVDAHIKNLTAEVIRVFGETKLSDWRDGNDLTKIQGGTIGTDTINANSIKIGARGISMKDVVFSHDTPGDEATIVSWTAGVIEFTSDDGGLAQVNMAASSPGNLDDRTWAAGTLYFCFQKQDNRPAWSSARSYVVGNLVQHLGTKYTAVLPSLGESPVGNPSYWTDDGPVPTDPAEMVILNSEDEDFVHPSELPDHVILATYTGATRLLVLVGGTMIDGSSINLDSITANHVDAAFIDTFELNADNIVVGTMRAGTIMADRIVSSDPADPGNIKWFEPKVVEVGTLYIQSGYRSLYEREQIKCKSQSTPSENELIFTVYPFLPYGNGPVEPDEWSSSTTYVAQPVPDKVKRGDSHYVAIAGSLNKDPLVYEDKWARIGEASITSKCVVNLYFSWYASLNNGGTGRYYVDIAARHPYGIWTQFNNIYTSPKFTTTQSGDYDEMLDLVDLAFGTDKYDRTPYIKYHIRVRVEAEATNLGGDAVWMYAGHEVEALGRLLHLKQQDYASNIHSL